MAWAKHVSAGHTCGGVAFGRLAQAGQCVRCDALRGGSKPVSWGKRDADSDRLRAIRAHDCKASRCGPVCTFGDW